MKDTKKSCCVFVVVLIFFSSLSFCDLSGMTTEDKMNYLEFTLIAMQKLDYMLLHLENEPNYPYKNDPYLGQLEDRSLMNRVQTLYKRAADYYNTKYSSGRLKAIEESNVRINVYLDSAGQIILKSRDLFIERIYVSKSMPITKEYEKKKQNLMRQYKPKETMEYVDSLGVQRKAVHEDDIVLMKQLKSLDSQLKADLDFVKKDIVQKLALEIYEAEITLIMQTRNLSKERAKDYIARRERMREEQKKAKEDRLKRIPKRRPIR